MKENMVPGNRKKTMGPSQPKSLTLKSNRTLIDVSVGNIIIDQDYYNGIRLQPPGCHVEIGLEGVLEFPSLKHIHLYELCKLQHICEVKLLAPKPESLWLRGCWDLKRVLAIHGDSRPIEDCKKNWWEKL
ncbi:hypothetical protein D1007_30219 [Hordeum vulgare]|nr:hypothetical protein D1007_30219 [Hordeum vulgare]